MQPSLSASVELFVVVQISTSHLPSFGAAENVAVRVSEVTTTVVLVVTVLCVVQVAFIHGPGPCATALSIPSPMSRIVSPASLTWWPASISPMPMSTSMPPRSVMPVPAYRGGRSTTS